MLSPNKVKITFVVPEPLQREMQERIAKEKYGMRGKSKWIMEAIINFLELSSFVTLVNLGDDMKGFEKAETIVVARDLKKKLDRAVLEIRKQHPILEGVQSRIIRTSIVQRLLRY